MFEELFEGIEQALEPVRGYPPMAKGRVFVAFSGGADSSALFA